MKPIRIIIFFIVFLSFAVIACAFQSTIVVPNGTGAQVRSGLNNALQAVTTCQSSSTAPYPTYPFQLWADTTMAPTQTVWKIRNWQNTAWLAIATINDTAGIITASQAANANQLGGQPQTFFQPYTTAINRHNVGSQSVSYAATAGVAYVTNATNANYATSSGATTNSTGTGSAPKTVENGLRIIRGEVITTNGSVVRISGTGFTVSRTGVGVWTITWATAFSDIPTFVVSSNYQAVYTVIGGSGANSATVRAYNTSGTPVDLNFDFIAIGPN